MVRFIHYSPTDAMPDADPGRARLAYGRPIGSRGSDGYSPSPYGITRDPYRTHAPSLMPPASNPCPRLTSLPRAILSSNSATEHSRPAVRSSRSLSGQPQSHYAPPRPRLEACVMNCMRLRYSTSVCLICTETINERIIDNRTLASALDKRHGSWRRPSAAYAAHVS